MSFRVSRPFWEGFVAGCVAFLLGGLVVLLVVFRLSASLPPLAQILHYRIPAPTVVYDRNGTPVYRFFEERREIATFPEIPSRVWRAFVAVEDRRFFRHWGVEPLSIFRALLVNLRAGRVVQGASTITQQLARNLFLTQERTLRRKLQEALLALELERHFSKEEILERYLNLIYFGHGVYGVKAAAKFYFGKDLPELSPLEIAVLVGLPKSPLGYSPLRHPDRALRRARVVLGVLRREGVLDEALYSRALAETLRVQPPDSAGVFVGTGRYAIEMVRQYVVDRYGEDFLYRGGGAIHTTLDWSVQRVVDSVVDTLLPWLEARFRLHPARAAWLEDSTLRDSFPEPPYLQTAVMVMNPATGEVLALLGGRNFGESQFNRAVQMKRQPGSAFKPFVFLAALDNGYQPADSIDDEPIALKPDPREPPWVPENYDGRYLGRITLRRALALSRNLATIRLGLAVGPATVAQYARIAGIQSTIPPYPSSLIGAADVTLWELMRAYATLANYGVRIRPFFIRKIVARDGRVLEEQEPLALQVMDSSVVYLLISMMESVLNEGTAISARLRYRFRWPAAGKTGTTDAYRDAWFLGFTRRYLAGVWVGFDSLRTIARGATGASMALPIWTSIMKVLHGDTLADSLVRPLAARDTFPVPSGVARLPICQVTGLLPTPFCPVREEVFLRSLAPQDTCPVHVAPTSRITTSRPEDVWWREERAYLRERRP